jgi:hypothetical protein
VNPYVAIALAAVTLVVNAFVSVTVKHSKTPADAYAKFRRAAGTAWNALTIAGIGAYLVYHAYFNTAPLTRAVAFHMILSAAFLLGMGTVLLFNRGLGLINKIVDAQTASLQMQRQHAGVTKRILDRVLSDTEGEANR